MKPELSGEITGFDDNLIKNFSILLRTLTPGYDIRRIVSVPAIHPMRIVEYIIFANFAFTQLVNFVQLVILHSST